VALGALYILLPVLFAWQEKIVDRTFTALILGLRLLFIGIILYSVMHYLPSLFFPCSIGIITGTLVTRIILIKFMSYNSKEPVR